MKKDTRRQARRQRALARFTLRPQRPDETKADYQAYLARKEAERKALAS